MVLCTTYGMRLCAQAVSQGVHVYAFDAESRDHGVSGYVTEHTTSPDIYNFNTVCNFLSPLCMVWTGACNMHGVSGEALRLGL